MLFILIIWVTYIYICLSWGVCGICSRLEGVTHCRPTSKKSYLWWSRTRHDSVDFHMLLQEHPANIQWWRMVVRPPATASGMMKMIQKWRRRRLYGTAAYHSFLFSCRMNLDICHCKGVSTLSFGGAWIMLDNVITHCILSLSCEVQFLGWRSFRLSQSRILLQTRYRLVNRVHRVNSWHQQEGAEGNICSR